MPFTNIWETAEAWVAGTLPPAEAAALQQRLADDAVFSAAFNESVNLIRSMGDNGKQKRFRAMLRDIQDTQAIKTAPAAPRRIAFTPRLWRTAAVAATTALLTSSFMWLALGHNGKKTDAQYSTISREVEHIKRVQQQQQQVQNQLIDNINKSAVPKPPPSDVRYTGTGFALTNDGYFVTAYHVINDGNGDFDSVYIQNHDGEYYKAFLVNFNAEKDIAILKVEQKSFRFGKGELPYTFAKDKEGLGARIFTLGYPKDDIVYSEGYISARNGYRGNDMQYTLELPAGHGQSGSPVIDEKGTIMGLLTAVGSQNEANTYAISAQALTDLISTLPDDKALKLPAANRLARLSRQEQIQKMEPYTFSVKVYKK